MADFRMKYPVTPFYVNQEFGEDPKTYSQFGIKGHNGLDLRASHGQPVYAAHDGTAYYEEDSSQGHGVVVVSNDKFDYKGKQVNFKTIYWHFCDPAKEPKLASPIYRKTGINTGTGVQVKQGDLLGYANNTGFSSGDHLHFGLKPVVPGSQYSDDAVDVNIGDWINVEQKNGYKGAIDPTPYFPVEVLPAGVSVPFAQAVKNLLVARLPFSVFTNALDVLKKKYNK